MAETDIAAESNKYLEDTVRQIYQVIAQKAFLSLSLAGRDIVASVIAVIASKSPNS